MTVEPWPPRWLTPVPESAIEAGRVMEPVVDFAEAFGIVTKDSVAGQTLWYDVWGHGISWVSPRSDVHLLQVVCELFDRRELLREAFLNDPTERKVNMSLLETEKLIQSSLSLLGFTPSDRARLGLAEVKKESRLDEMLARRAARDDG